MENNYPSVADIAAVSGNRGYGNGFGGGFGGEGLWLFAILALMGGGFGGFGGNRRNCATTEDVANGFNFNALQGKTNEILNATYNNNQNLSNAICNLGYQNSRDFANLSQQLADCCCITQRGIDKISFDLANYSAAINANTTAGIQKLWDKMVETEAMHQNQKINNLERKLELANVVRYPMFATIANPFCGTFGYQQNYGYNCAM